VRQVCDQIQRKLESQNGVDFLTLIAQQALDEDQSSTTMIDTSENNNHKVSALTLFCSPEFEQLRSILQDYKDITAEMHFNLFDFIQNAVPQQKANLFAILASLGPYLEMSQK